MTASATPWLLPLPPAPTPPKPLAAPRSPKPGRLRGALLSAIALALPGLASGCLEHEESITVHADGAVEVVHRIRGDAADLDGGAAGVPGGAAFTVERGKAVRDDGKEEHTLTARARFAPRAELPRRFATGARDDAVAFDFPTTLTVTKEGGRKVYRFVRTYQPRRWAPYQLDWDRCFPAEVRALYENGRKLEELTDEERKRLFEAALQHEMGKAQTFADDALARLFASEARLPDARLAARVGIASYFAEKLSWTELERLLKEPAEVLDKRGREVEKDLEALVVERAGAALGMGARDRERLAAELAAERRAHAVTEDLGDETFTVRLALPGALVGHNGDAVEGGAVVWRFHGKDLRDCGRTLIAVSAVE